MSSRRRPCRQFALLAAAGLLLVATPGWAAPGWAGGDAADAAASALLEDALLASRSVTYTGTQYVASWRERAVATALVDIRHTPSGGAVVRRAPTAGSPGEDTALATASAGLDPRMLPLLEQHYELRVAADGRCAGRDAHVVEARRPGVSGAGAVAGRFWLDAETGLVLRRDVLDEQGRRMSSSAFLDLSVEPGPKPSPEQPASDGSDTGEPLDDDELDALRRDGWPVLDALPGGFALFDARVRTHDGDRGRQVVHLAYSDGLSTTSLFAQRGALGARPPEGFGPREMAGSTVWSRGGPPERVVWGGGGRVWTLVSDAPAVAVTDAVAALPHQDPPKDGFLARLVRGAQRLGSMLNPFS